MLIPVFMLTLAATVTGAEPRWGHEPYATASPLDVAVAADGQMYVADAAAGKVVVLKPDFTPAGREIAAPGVTGVDVAADGRVAMVTGGAAGTVQIVGADGKELLRIAPAGAEALVDAWGVSFDAHGNVFVFDAGAGLVRVFDAQGKHAFDFGEYTWQRRYHSRKTDKDVDEQAKEKLCRPCRGAFLPDGRLIIADYEGPIVDPELDRRAGMFSVWQVDVAARQAKFDHMLPQGDYYPSSKAGDVAVEAKTGRIYVTEADFPLTDHDFVRVYDNVDEQSRYGTNFFPIRFLTHPRGVGVLPNGDVVVAEADKNVVFAIPRTLFDTPRGTSDPLEWPKVLRIPVCEQERVVLEYTTLEPVVSRVEYAPLVGNWYDYPAPPPAEGRKVAEAPALNEQGAPRAAGEPDRNHRIELTGLKPGQRYAYRYLVSPRAYPGPLWSETFLATTQPPTGKTQYLDAEVTLLLFTNVWTPVKDANVRPQPAEPGPMTAEEIAGVKERLDWARRFYWINSRGRFNVHFTYVIDDTPYPNGPTANYGYWPDDDHHKIDEILARHGAKHADTAGLCTIYGYRHWDDQKKAWVLSGSGGNTWGSIHDGSAINTFSAGGDTCWLFTHEYGHSMGINYGYAGQVYHFNHFHWNYLPTDYGAHYDGMSAMCREFSDVAYWSNKYGRVVQTDDADNDGLADADPRVPLDEQRFGSDPSKADTDGDGLTDFEEMMSTEGLTHYAQAFGMRQLEPVFEPDPRNVDSDGDGVRDGEDPYPLYPWSTEVRFAAVQPDGHVTSGEWPKDGFCRQIKDETFTGDVRLAWDFGHLYIGLTQKAGADVKLPPRVYMELDANNDGMTVGGDNLEIWFEPQADGGVHVRTNYNDTIIRIKPRWRANILPNPADVVAHWTRQGDELQMEVSLPQTKDAGLDCTRFEQLGFMFQLRPDGGDKEYRLMEPLQHFDVRLR